MDHICYLYETIFRVVNNHEIIETLFSIVSDLMGTLFLLLLNDLFTT